MTLFEMKSNLAMLGEQIREDAAWIAEKAADPTVKTEELDAKAAHRDDLQRRYDMLKAAHDEEEQKQRSKAVVKSEVTAQDVKMTAKAAFYRDALEGKTVGKTYEGLGGIPANDADLGSGSKLLPVNMSRELLTEPFEVNPLRDVCRITNISGYIEPKLGYTIEDADLADVTDKQTANEIALSGDSVTYGRLKAMVSATVKNTVLRGTDTDLVARIEETLRSAIAKREKHFAFQTAQSINTNSDTAHAHMSFYNGTVDGVTGDVTYAITAVTGATMYEAIVNALADLADDFAGNARVMMKKSDYYAMVKELANSAEALFGRKEASILGYPVVFCDKAVIPVVGDFRFYGINYDIDSTYETDKDALKGEYYFVLTAWGDQQIRLKSAFRLAIVAEGE